MRRYILFGWSAYSPQGGMEDCQGIYETADDAKEAFKIKYKNGSGHIYDLHINKIILEYGNWSEGKGGFEKEGRWIAYRFNEAELTEIEEDNREQEKKNWLLSIKNEDYTRTT